MCIYPHLHAQTGGLGYTFGNRINRVQIRTLQNDPSLKISLQPYMYLSIAACRLCERMDIDYMLQISSLTVIKVFEDKVETITQTIIPEKFRLYEGNKKGVLQSPAGICLGPPGTIILTDSGKRKLFLARLHYPVDVY